MKRCLLVFSVFALLACSESTKHLTAKPTAEAESKMPSSPIEPTNPAAVAALARLGFTVFESPLTIPFYKLDGLSGQQYQLTNFSGQYLFLNVWATWCPPCRAEMPSMESLYQTLAPEGLAMLAISAREKAKTVKDFLAQNPYSFPIALDESGALTSQLASRGIPTTYILNREGLVIAGMIGGRQWDDETTVKIFRGLINHE